VRSLPIVVVMALSSQVGASTSPALNDYRRASNQLADGAFRISSGLRFVRLADDSGSITIASRYQSDITSFKAALQNSGKAGSLLDVANSGLNDISDLIDAMRALVVDVQTGLYNDREVAGVEGTLADQQSQIDSIATTTNFSGIALLDGTANRSFTVGNDVSTSTIVVAISSAKTSRLFPGGALSLSSAANITASLAAIDNAKDLLKQTIADVGAFATRFEASANVATDTIGGLNAARNLLLQNNDPAELARNTVAQIQQHAAAALLAQGQLLSPSLLNLVS